MEIEVVINRKHDYMRTAKMIKRI